MSGRRRPRGPRGRRPLILVQLGEAVRAARLAQGLSEPALARRAQVGERTVRRLQAGQSCHAAQLLQILGALGGQILGGQVRFAAPLPQQVLEAAIAHFGGAEAFLGRPALSASEARLLAEDLQEDLWGGERWQGGAETTRRDLLDKLRRMAEPRHARRKDPR